VGCAEMRHGRGAFYWCRGGAGWPDGGGERPVAVEHHDGGGGSHFGRGIGRGVLGGGGVVPSVAQKEGKESGLAGVEGEAGRSWAESGVGPEFKRNSFRISIDFRMWQNFGNWHKEI
jgi:hypothetical protein